TRLQGDWSSDVCSSDLERQHIGVPLDDDRLILLRDRRPRAVEAVEQVALAEELALGRVDVLRVQRVVLAQLPRLEAEHATARVEIGRASCRERVEMWAG